MVDKIYWTNPEIDFLINHYIREYDMSRAGQTALFMAGCIDESTYIRLCSLPRMDRQIQTGLLIQEHPEFEDARKDILAKVRTDFQEQNGLYEDDIVSIKNDAIFVVDKVCSVDTFGLMKFKVKNTYSSYYRFGRTELYYYGDTREVDNKIDVKNISDKKLELHKDFMLDFLHYLFLTAQVNVYDCISTLQQFESDYLNLNLDLGFYREFNATSSFSLKESGIYLNFKAEHLPQGIDKREIDINYNLSFIRHLYKLYAGIILR